MINLDQVVRYQIIVPGHLQRQSLSSVRGLELRYEEKPAGWAVSVIEGDFDQAALQGLLRKLYTVGVPLVSVVLVPAEGTA